MKDRLTKLFTTFLAVVLLVGMSPAAASTAYAASWNSGTVASLSWSNLLKNLFGGSNKGDSSDKEKGDASLDNSQSNDATGEQSDPEPSGGSTTQKPLELTKRINDDGTKITLEAYATGKVTRVETYTPTDIVLVLDQSGSMNEALGSVTKVSGSLDTSKTYLVYTETNNNRKRYTPVTYDASKKQWIDENGKTYSTRNNTFYNGVTKIQSLKSAVNTFIQSIEKSISDSKNKAVYRVSLVGYSSDSNTKILTGTNVNNTLKQVNDSNEKSEIISALNNLSGKGVTRSDLGISLANDIFKANPIPNGEKRNRAVIMFTDGEPNDSNGFEHNIAIDAINNAKITKNTYNASVYTVGILDGANPTATFPEGYSDNSSERINRYMHYISSNYPNASGSYKTEDNWLYGTTYSDFVYIAGNDGNKTRGFYMTAKDASGLNKVFANIAGSIESPSSNIDLGEQASLRDIISEDFHLPEGTTTDKIIVKTAKYAGKDDNGNLTWEKATSFDDAEVSIDNKTINVTNFSYKDNYVLDTKDGPVGYKLIVEIPVEINRTFGGNNIESNAAAGIYESKSSETALITAKSPKVDDPIDYEIAGTTQTIPDGTSVTKESLFEYVTGTDGFEYTPDGLKNKFVNLTYTIKDGNDIVGIYTVKAGEVTGSWSKENESILKDLHFDKEYSVECKITPITGGTVTEATKTATSYVYIKGVTRAFVIDFDKPVTYTKDKVFTENQISTPEKINAIEYGTGTNTYGTLTLNNDKSITYRLNKFMDGIDRYTFNVANNCTQKVNMIPATSVYYDDSFGSKDVNNGGIVYSSDWEAITNKQANKELQDAAQGLDANYGYDSSYDNFIGNSNGTVHKVTGANDATTASIQFTGTGIDVYALTNQTGGKVYATLTNKDKSVEKYLTREYSYKTGELFHVPVISFNNLPKGDYTLTITIADGSTFYLDGLRIYNPLGTAIDQLPAEAKEAYEKDGELGSQLAYIRDGILGKSTIISDVQGTVYIDDYASYSAPNGVVPGHNVTLGETGVLKEYTRYGCKTETYLPAGKSLTLTLDQDYKNIQLGLKSSEKGATYTINGGDTRNIKSSTDMYYKVTAEGNKIKITNTSNAMIEITALKVVK